jgi:hypothetical protein
MSDTAAVLTMELGRQTGHIIFTGSRPSECLSGSSCRYKYCSVRGDSYMLYMKGFSFLQQ